MAWETRLAHSTLCILGHSIHRITETFTVFVPVGPSSNSFNLGNFRRERERERVCVWVREVGEREWVWVCTYVEPIHHKSAVLRRGRHCLSSVYMQRRAPRWGLSDHRIIPTNQQLPSTAYQLMSPCVFIVCCHHSCNEQAVHVK
jgi:hypothetical protein